MFGVSYFINDVEYQTDFETFNEAYQFANAHWNSLDKETRENYTNNGWQTCIVDYSIEDDDNMVCLMGLEF